MNLLKLANTDPYYYRGPILSKITVDFLTVSVVYLHKLINHGDQKPFKRGAP